MAIILGYILLSVATIATIMSIALGDTYTIEAVIGIVFASSLILRCKSKKRSPAVNLAYWVSSIIIVFSYALKQFIG